MPDCRHPEIPTPRTVSCAIEMLSLGTSTRVDALGFGEQALSVRSRSAVSVLLVIDPDTKDWTWVLARRCPECGFDASCIAGGAVPALVRSNASDWQTLFVEGSIAPGRSDPAKWSSLEYACHVRDVYRIYDQRITLMLEHDDPLFPNWDQDAAAEAERYDEQDPHTVVRELVSSAATLSDRLDGLSADDWGRTGNRSDGASFTIGSISRYMIHDPIHHLWDVTVGRA